MLPFRLVLLAMLVILLPGRASDIVVVVMGVRTEKGEVGCALFRSPVGFPGDTEKATAQMHKASVGSVECKFENAAPGTYAVAVFHDLNGDRKVDKNMIGMPTEDWGVSNNVHPRFRTPRFDEASFAVKPGDAAVRLEIKIAR